MSSRLFQNVREKRGLAYAVFSGLSAYRDAGNITIYAGCANEAVDEVIDLCVEELRAMKQTPVPDAELRRAKDHLKGSLMLSLENTASRMSHLARQEIYFDRHFGLDETLAGVERVTSGRRPAGRRAICSRTARWRRPCSGRAFPICRGRSWIWDRGPAAGSQPGSREESRRLGPTPDAGSPRLAADVEMIPRYTNPEMGAIWSDQRRYETWLDVELAATDAMAERRPRAGRRGAGAARQGGVRRRPHRGDRAGRRSTT